MMSLNFVCLYFFFVSIISSVASDRCTTDDEWVGDNLTLSSNFECYGYQCCLNTTILTTLSEGSNYCDSARSCVNSNLKATTAHLLACGGYLGCAFTNSISSYVCVCFYLPFKLLMSIFVFQSGLSSVFAFTMVNIEQNCKVAKSELNSMF